jgi:23S rRNA pseudouridine2605 synthase
MALAKDARHIGLARALSKLGYCSRSKAAELIRAGRIQLNGATRKDPEAPVRLQRDRIAVDGHAVLAAPKIYLLLNKPRGVVTTASDEKGRQTVYALLDPGLGWVGPLGRLDKASEGLLLLTNDSEWAARIADPARHLSKTYHVQVDCVADSDLLRRIRRGVVAEGDPLRAKSARVLRQGQKNSWLEIILDQGKNRQIRRMLAVFGVGVLRLVRVSVGPLALGDLKKGAVRPLTSAEKRALDQALDHGPNMVR